MLERDTELRLCRIVNYLKNSEVSSKHNEESLMGLRQRNNKVRCEILELTAGPDRTGERRGGGREGPVGRWQQKSSCNMMWFHQDGDCEAREEMDSGDV